MDLLQIAIKQAGSVNTLADQLGVVPSAIGNWKTRGLPKSWQLALSLKYKKAIEKHKSSHDLSKDKAVPSSSMDKPTANAFAWMGKSQAMAGTRAKSIKQIKQDANRVNPESNIGMATRETNSFKAPR